VSVGAVKVEGVGGKSKPTSSYFISSAVFPLEVKEKSLVESPIETRST